MATWTDKQLAGHKRAQSYISSAGATLGVAALGAAGLKSKGVTRAANRAATKLTARTGSKRRAGMLRAIPKAGNASMPLTTASAGVGGVGGYNFAAIQSQEAKRSRVKKNEEMTSMDFGTAGSGGVNLERVEKRNYESGTTATTRDYRSKKTRGTRAGYDASLAAGVGGTLVASGGLADNMRGRFAVSGFRDSGGVASPEQMKRVRRLGNRTAAAMAGGTALAAGGVYGANKFGRKLDQRRKEAGRKAMPMSSVKKNLIPLEEVGKRQDWMNISEHQRRAQDGRRTRRQGGALAAGAASVGAGAATLGGVREAQRLAGFARDAKTTYDLMGRQSLGRTTKAGMRAVGANPRGALMLGAAAGVGVGAGMVTAGGAKNKHHNAQIARLRRQRAVAKAFDSEASRGKRLHNYERGTAWGGGAAVGAGALMAGSAGRGAAQTIRGGQKMSIGRLGGKLKPMVRQGAKGAALTAAGAGSIVASERIKSYRKTKGRPYKALRG